MARAEKERESGVPPIAIDGLFPLACRQSRMELDLGTALVLTGAAFVALKLTGALYGLYKAFVRPAKNLRKYGSWAVVTGATGEFFSLDLLLILLLFFWSENLSKKTTPRRGVRLIFDNLLLPLRLSPRRHRKGLR